MQQALTFKKILFFIAVICGAMWLSYLFDDNLGWGWSTDVVHNWQEFGLLNLHGKLVYNPGGFGMPEHPEVYRGMSPVCLYPAYIAVKLLNGAGLGTLAFHVFLLPILLWAIWSLLGKGDFAVMVAAIAILCPGYMRSLKSLDPNTLSILPVLPYAAIVTAILKRPKLTPAWGAALIILTLAMLSLNWTTAWICAPCIFLFLGIPGLNRKGLILLICTMFIGVPLVVAASFAAKVGGGPAGANAIKPLEVIAGYTWGSGGYGVGLTTGRAFLRLAFVNIVGLFPLCVVFVYTVIHRLRRGAPLSWLMFAPLALTIADMVIMRNYFGHHPPMAGALLLAGLVFSITLLRVPASVETKDSLERIPFQFAPVIALLCFGYGLAVLMFFRANEAEIFSLAHLIQGHTARSDIIAVVKKTDPGIVSITDRLEEPMDRHVEVVDDVKDLSGEKSHYVVLSSMRLNDPFVLAAQSATPAKSWLSKAGDWFNRTIARRNAGDRLELSETYYLYTVEQ